MAIEATTRADSQAIVSFTEHMRTAYHQLKAMHDKITWYADAIAALQAGTATPRQIKFVEIVGVLIGQEEIQRLSTVHPLIQAFLTEIETNFSDFLID